MNHNHKQRKSQGTINTHQVHCHDAITQTTASPLVGRSMLPNRVRMRYGAGVLQLGGAVQRFERRRVESPQALGTIWSNRAEGPSAVGAILGKPTIQRLVDPGRREEHAPDLPSNPHNRLIRKLEWKSPSGELPLQFSDRSNQDARFAAQYPSTHHPSEKPTIETTGIRSADMSNSNSIAHPVSQRSEAPLPLAIETRRVSQSATLAAAATQFHCPSSVRQRRSIRSAHAVQATGKIVQAKASGRNVALDPEAGKQRDRSQRGHPLLPLAAPTDWVQTAGRTIQAKVSNPETTGNAIASQSGTIGYAKLDKIGTQADVLLAQTPDLRPAPETVFQAKRVGSDANTMMPLISQMAPQTVSQGRDFSEERLRLSGMSKTLRTDLPPIPVSHSVLKPGLIVQTKPVQPEIENKGGVKNGENDNDSIAPPRQRLLPLATNANVPIQKQGLRSRKMEVEAQSATAAAASNSTKQASAPNSHEFSASSPETTATAAVDVQKIAEQVSRILTRQLAVERERRGISRWYS